MRSDEIVIAPVRSSIASGAIFQYMPEKVVSRDIKNSTPYLAL